MDEPTLTIGQVAARAGLKTSAIRYYERVGLLPEPERRSGQRRYTEATVRRLEVIAVAKRAGFTLDDARMLLATGDDGAPAHKQVRQLAQRKLPEVEALINRAESMKRWLTVASGCNCDTLDVCRLFENELDTAPAPETSTPLQLMRVDTSEPPRRSRGAPRLGSDADDFDGGEVGEVGVLGDDRDFVP